MKIKRILVIIAFSSSLIGCGSKISCVQEDFVDDLAGLIAENMKSQLLGVYWSEVMNEKVEYMVSSVKEIKISDNKKTATCAATLGVTLPMPSAKNVATESLLLGLRTASQGDIYAAFADTSSPLPSIAVSITYGVSILEKPAADGRTVEVDVKNVADIMTPLIYRNIQMVGSDIEKPMSDGSKMLWSRDQVSYVKKSIRDQPGLADNVKKVRSCVVEKTASWIGYDTYIAYLAYMTNPILAVSVGLSQEKTLANLIEFEQEATRSCGA